MSGPSLVLRNGIAGRIDMAGVLPVNLANRPEKAIAATQLRLDGQSVPLGELFSIKVGADEHLVIQASAGHLDHLGQGMSLGSLRLEGAAGHFAGQGMKGGEVIVTGAVEDFAASGMVGGRLCIEGNAGDWLGAPLIGERAGMSGGVVTVAGNVGDRMGDRMRRGLVLVRGRAGVACGARMLAGTLVVAGGCGELAGFGLRRGSLILGIKPDALPPTFNDSGVADLSWLGLLRRQAQTWLPGALPATGRLRRYMGDLAFGGKGEVLVPA